MKRLSLFRKILLATLLLALCPFLLSSLIMFQNLRSTGRTLSEQIGESEDLQASRSLIRQAAQVAAGVSQFLHECERDLLLAAALPKDPAILQSFYASRKGDIWYRGKRMGIPADIRESIPRYASLDLVDRSGRETFSIRNGKAVPREQLRDVSRPENTEFLSERYFAETRRLRRGGIHVSRVTGFHLTKQEQLGGAKDPEQALDGARYRGVIRFATPLYDSSGRFDGIIVLSLDHRHLMEFTQHINPAGEGPTVFPSYQSGNYAFLFDDEGWIITHPKFWDIRGVDRHGKLVPPYTAESSPEEVRTGRIPFNLDHAGFIHPSYPEVARQVRLGKAGSLDTTNVGGARKVMAFAPIRYGTGAYSRHGVFGGVTIGFQADRFHELAREGSALIHSTMREHLAESALIVALVAMLVFPSALFLSRGITRPLELFSEGAKRVAEGDTTHRVVVDSNDEIGLLADAFNRMSRQLERRRKRLMKMLKALRSSRSEILNERNFKESILESISSAILTLSPDGVLTSINGTGKALLDRAELGAHFRTIFSGWDDMPERIQAVLEGRKGYGREPLALPSSRFFEIGFFPISSGAAGGLTVTLREETEKQRLREEMTRMDRLASLGKLSAGIAHEIRNPLTGISLLLDDLHDRLPEHESRATMRRALSEIERMDRLITALLHYAAPPVADFRTADLNAVIEDALLLLRKECEKKGVALTFAPGEIPPFPFDAEKMNQAVLNLVKNALEVSRSGDAIEVAVSRNRDSGIITVADSGPGIPPEDIPLLFEPFFTRKGAGTGLGLSITQRIAEEHRGTVTVESAPGKGSVFTVSVPLA